MKASQQIPSREHVASMFDSIGKVYDMTNRVISLGQDPWFRRALVRTIPKDRPLKMIDIATGTCDQLLINMKLRENIVNAVGIDVSIEMLKVGVKKVFKAGYGSVVQLLVEDGHKTSFSDDSFDIATLSFGIRNFMDPQKGLAEIYRILKKSGSVHILEFSTPKSFFLKKGFLFYIRYVLPFIGALFSSNLKAYRYLNETIETFAQREEFSRMLETAGFNEVAYRSLFFGVVTIYTGKKL
ncbi:MAG: bifunctional demethylmenaquinone methyltransferase/2-methoxy-6-polyprenyl-1,4-benzoquinol methylase UbiE [Chlamydiae bacterium]|nr:bifunctional demethylmenaquinone methyltransferase/2-methoxy-6-polyprenyl-1,4-benzoquinol methylase UbiE [Chlamydiota bacterium]